MLSLGHRRAAVDLSWRASRNSPPSSPCRWNTRTCPTDLEISSDVVESVYLELHGPSGRLRGAWPTSAATRWCWTCRGCGRASAPSPSARATCGCRAASAWCAPFPRSCASISSGAPSRSVPVQVRFAAQPPDGLRGGRSAGRAATASDCGSGEPRQPRQVRGHRPHRRQRRGGHAEFRVNAFVDDPHVRFIRPPQVTVKVPDQEEVNG